MPALPEWADRRTVEWCAAICDAAAVRVVVHDRRRGAEACAALLRWHLQNDTAPLPRGRSLIIAADDCKERGGSTRPDGSCIACDAAAGERCHG